MRMRRITIDWSYPMDFEHILLESRTENIGIYYITQKLGNQVYDLYIGKTVYSFGSRLADHAWKWVNQYGGIKQVRLGTIVSPKRLSKEERRILIEDAEKTLIFLQHSLEHNTQCRKGSALNNRLYITNTGYRGNLSAEMYIPDENWIEDQTKQKGHV